MSGPQNGETHLATVAIIGSFRQFLSEVTTAGDAFLTAGVIVTSPRGSTVVEAGIEFVRFPSDNDLCDDATVQSIALHRIAAADAVYVVAPDGYVGRTTCYEIGRLIQMDRPLYFSARPHDLPVQVSDGVIVNAAELAGLLGAGLAKPWSFWSDGANRELEAALLAMHPDASL